ncbi:P-loop containing nucleoside triphosphate hydrolase protein [Xylariales sp. AK1849]|nr:P-loop containing nucleoside triphosphate hydrolase protein [Xylariales sp. AK1849]
MPSLVSRRRSRSVYEEGEDDRQSSEIESLKRRRRGRGSNGIDDNDDDEDEVDDDSFFSTQITNGSSHGGNGYQPGAIVRVKLTNFVTYENAEFFPGPNLNMIIGPNGTGKSSLVCAICLGLGYPTSVLDRASKMGDFVTHGKDAAIVETELQKRPGDRHNPVVRLRIVRETSSRSWWLNGRESTHKKVQEVVKGLRIACDNLCQFLPQEKVASFAALTPVQLLHETLRAAAPEEMIEWQSQLKDYHRDYKKVKEMFDSNAETLKNYENRQQGLQADVDRLNERDAIKNNIEEMRKARACAEYNTSRDRYKEAQKKKKEAERSLRDLEEACGPALEAVNHKERYRAKIEAVLNERRNALKDAEGTADQDFHAIEALSERVKDCENKTNGEQISFKARRKEIGKCRQTITSLESQKKQEPPPFIAAEWNEKIRGQEHLLREVHTEKREVDRLIDDAKQQAIVLNAAIKEIRNSIEDLNSQEGQKISHLKSVAPEVAKGWEWLQGNLAEFEKEIFGPPMLTCSLKDDRYSSLIQSMLQQNDFLCFTAQTRNDHKKLSEQFYKVMGLSVTIRTCGSEFQSFRPPISADEVHRLGLDGFAVDYLEGPEPVLAMLCSERYLHSSGVALGEITSEQFDELQNGQRINTWATGQTYFRVIRRREYGPGATTTSTKKINAGRFWTDQPVDTAEKAELQRKLDATVQEKDALHKEYRVAQAKSQELEEKESDVNKELENNLEGKQEALSHCRTRVMELDAQRDEMLVEKAKAVLLHQLAVSQIREAHQALLDVQIRLIEATSDVKGLKLRNVEITNRLQEKKQEIKEFSNNAEVAKKEASEARTEVERIVALGDPSDIHRYNAIVEGKTPEDIDHEINAEQAKLELIHIVDPSVVRQFEKRAKEIESLTRKKEEMTAKLDALGDQLKELMEKFEPKLDELVAQVNEAFGHNFDMISCAGQVGVHKDEDFDQWAIEVKVKFREKEALQLLNQHRQSGGERAVSTVFYIMALQSMAQAPFRVVDEINQGMDPRNERMVHERMVEIACREHTSQYFLITPKLLNGLRYDKRMRVMCIASGAYVPENAIKMDFDKLVRKQRALKAAAAAR